MRIKDQTEFSSGAMFFVIGVSFAVVASGYQLGTAARMGPGFFPFWLGAILTLIGFILMFKSMTPAAYEDKLESWDILRLAVILGSVVLFGVLLNYLGFIAAIIGLVMTSSLASHDFDWRMTAVNTLILTVICYIIFIYGLGLPLQLWPQVVG